MAKAPEADVVRREPSLSPGYRFGPPTLTNPAVEVCGLESPCYHPTLPGVLGQAGCHVSKEVRVSDEAVPGIPAAPAGTPFHTLLSALSVEDRLRMFAGSQVIRVTGGEAVLTSGQHVDHLAVVLEGTFRVEVPDRHGLPVEVATFRPGDYSGEMSFLRGERASATVRAVGNGALLLVPHSLLAEITEHDTAVTRELARTVATRLSASNERFRAMRPGRAVACVVASPGAWPKAAIAQVARSASMHACKAVLLVDATGGPPAFEWCERLPSIASLVEDPALLSAFDGFSSAEAPAVGHADAADVSPDQLLRTVSQLQSKFPLVLVCGEAPIAGLDGPFWFRPASEQAAPHDCEVLLEERAVTPTPARLRMLGAQRRSTVIAVQGGGQAALDRQPLLHEPAEPWPSIDRVARMMLRRTVGLALGAGGAKGYAHIGAARALRHMGVPFDYLAGCSIGAPLAAGFAVGMGAGAVKRELDTTFRRALRPTLPLHSFLSSRRIVREMNRLVAGRSWDDLAIPLAIVAVDLDRREEVVFESGPPAQILAASMAIPGIFAPQEYNGRRLADGGLLNPVPTSTVASIGADVVIGVKLTDPVPDARRAPRRPRFYRPGTPPILDNIVSAIDIMQWKIIEDGAAEADITIVPRFASPVGIRDFRRGPELMAAGEAAAWAMHPAIKKLLPWVKDPPAR